MDPGGLAFEHVHRPTRNANESSPVRPATCALAEQTDAVNAGFYSIGRLSGQGPSGKAVSIRSMSTSVKRRCAAPAVSAMCLTLEAFGMAKSGDQRVK